jgi:hypothetical protein
VGEGQPAGVLSGTSLEWHCPRDPPAAKDGDRWNDGETVRERFGGEWIIVAHIFRPL